MGPLLTHFIWDSHGVTWDGGKKTWTPDLPTDAQIIMHLFAVYMDLAMPSQPAQANDRFPFSYKHYVPMEGKPDPTTRLQIKQTSKSPPEYSLVVEGSMWEVVPKRLNVWYTLVLFIFIVMRESGGYIGQINIGTRLIGLGDVVEGYDV
ncbi:cytochrome B561, N terminal-domain-containing protein [Gamsiella multidivaricata]|uniref:cytochrome B561, N terminal-domain-containing protein n=1 Tax=Gamsiella multidivaricata TaxID=101098 RepID=UPI00221FF959|nr:cytochrome B561, N terminal-domain-containing protein [Gamsiella multidivaricata]KAI7830421.1 cytochrome B561, N terminal-domain-containing protein [Gamsiella multidivaricata]